MAKFQSVVLIFAIVLAVAVAEPARTRQRSKVLARQEAEPVLDVVTPYPSADELKPEIPFEEEVAEEVPFADEPQPNEVYDAPEVTLYSPDEVYGPPENELPAVEAEKEIAAEEIPAEEQLPARLVAARRAAALRQRQAAYRQAVNAKRSAKLRAAATQRRA